MRGVVQRMAAAVEARAVAAALLTGGESIDRGEYRKVGRVIGQPMPLQKTRDAKLMF